MGLSLQFSICLKLGMQLVIQQKNWCNEVWFLNASTALYTFIDLFASLNKCKWINGICEQFSFLWKWYEDTLLGISKIRTVGLLYQSLLWTSPSWWIFLLLTATWGKKHLHGSFLKDLFCSFSLVISSQNFHFEYLKKSENTTREFAS